jgi:hypothetical protein
LSGYNLLLILLSGSTLLLQLLPLVTLYSKFADAILLPGTAIIDRKHLIVTIIDRKYILADAASG